MGAPGPVSPWIPEDDLLLKNAVEAGASLESLAKGAVKFSRRFTVHELQERWYALLYDPVVSTEASTRMIESERSTSAHPLKVNKVGVSKENKAAGKRKAETVRSLYHAMRKRISNEPFDTMDLRFLVGPSNRNYVGDVDGPLSANCDHGHPIYNPFELQASEMDTVAHAFPDGLMDDNAFPTGLQNLGEENFQIDQSNMHKEFSHVLVEDMPPTGNILEGGAMGDPKDLPDHILFKAGDQVSADQSKMCLDFEGSKIFNSPVSGCVAPFNNMECSPMPIWKTVSAPDLPVDISLGDKDLPSGDTFQLPDDYNAMNAGTSGYDGPSGVKVKMETDYDDFQARNSPEGYLAEISNSLLNFTNEEELFMNGAGKDIIDKSYYDGLSSLLLNSPKGIGQEHVADMTESSAAPNVCPANSLSLPHESNKVSDTCGEQMSCDSQIQMQLPASASNPEFPEMKDGVICCVLNTEDPDIPCNDVPLQLLLRSRTTFVEQRFQGASMSISSPANGLAGDQRISEVPNPVHKEQNVTGDSHVSSLRIGSHAVRGMDQSPAVSHFGVPKPNSTDVACRVSGVSCVGSDMINVAKAGTEVLLPGKQKDKSQEVLNSTDCCINNSICIQEEHNVAPAVRNQESAAHAEPTPMNVAVSEPVLNSPMADQDELPSDGDEDDDIPYYSDIEAMILDMDLDPDVEDLNANEEVSRYHQEGTKRTIMRLEQSAHAHMQRTIASHGALAILYGWHSKHYITRPEVLLGRATEEDIVDIDLGREGRANKISRKQAIIKMDIGGSFSMKNLSKFPICVNSREIGFKQSISLNSGCLIEIRGMAYIFESNQTCVKMYLDSNPNSIET